MLATYVPLFILFIVAAALSAVFFVITPLLGTKNPNPEKMTPVRVRQRVDGRPHVKLSVKFYLTAILFVVFDIEAVFIYPWAIQFRSLGWAGLAQMFGFRRDSRSWRSSTCWKKGALEWEN